jgi:hypothetical protein
MYAPVRRDMTHTPGRVGVDAVLEPLELVHGWMMDHLLRFHFGHFSELSSSFLSLSLLPEQGIVVLSLARDPATISPRCPRNRNLMMLYSDLKHKKKNQ